MHSSALPLSCSRDANRNNERVTGGGIRHQNDSNATGKVRRPTLRPLRMCSWVALRRMGLVVSSLLTAVIHLPFPATVTPIRTTVV